MQHKIPVDQLGPTGPAMASAVEACVHCGFCLPTCPTYVELGEEMDSPRGRIFLMKEVLEGQLDAQEAAPYIDRCLGCLGCVTSCPSGVAYGDLITAYRARSEASRRRSFSDRFLRRLVLATLPYPGRFRLAARTGRLVRPLARLLPRRMAAMLDLLPDRLPSAQPEVYPAKGATRARVALLAGCAQQVLAPQINWATLRVLAHNGVEVVVPRDQGCCGALAAHTGAADLARAAARHNLNVFPDDVDAVITNAAGCGSGMHEYPLWLTGEPEQEAAAKLASRTKDVCQFLHDLGAVTAEPLETPLRVAYHDACHLGHAQGVRSAPRQLLRSIPNLDLLEIADGDLCCGSAGTYSIEQPEIARDLGRRKAATIVDIEADVVVMGNIGCMTQIEVHLRALRNDIPVLHTVELLDRAYRGVI